MTDVPSGSSYQDKLDEQLFECIRSENGYHPDVLRSLLEAGANPNAIDKLQGIPILHVATVWHNLDAIETLLAADADPNGRDNQGNTALHKALLPDISLRLMLAGASPSAHNADFRQPQNEIALQNMSPSYHAILLQTKRLLEDCIQIEKAADSHALSDSYWENMWPDNPFGYPPPASPVPHLLSLQYFLKKAENNGAQLSKKHLFSTTGAGEGLCKYLAHNGSNIEAWKRHCAHHDTPMTMKDWHQSEVVDSVDPAAAHLLFDVEEITRLPDLKPLYAFYEELPSHVRKQPSAELEKTLSKAISQWLHEGAGKNLSSDAVRQTYREMPDALKPLVALQQELLNRQSSLTTVGKGR